MPAEDVVNEIRWKLSVNAERQCGQVSEVPGLHIFLWNNLTTIIESVRQDSTNCIVRS